MPTLAFKLRNVPDDEAEDIRALLSDANILFYETDAGNWGISMPGLWLENDADHERVKTLIEQYQQERAAKARVDYHQLKQRGEHRTVFDKIREKPIASLGIIAFCAALLYFSVKPFLSL